MASFRALSASLVTTPSRSYRDALVLGPVKKAKSMTVHKLAEATENEQRLPAELYTMVLTSALDTELANMTSHFLELCQTSRRDELFPTRLEAFIQK